MYHQRSAPLGGVGGFRQELVVSVILEPPAVRLCCPTGGVWLQSKRQRQSDGGRSAAVPEPDLTWLKVG